MALNFPSGPSVGQTFTSNGVTWQWNGTSWTNLGLSLPSVFYSGTVGDGTSTTITITHNLNKSNVFYSVRENSTGNTVYPDIGYANANAAILYFVSAPSVNQYAISIIGY